jgi:hypothetical protein
MRNLLTTLVLFLLFSLAAAAQSYEGSITYLKKDLRSMQIDFPYPSDQVEDVIAQKLEKLGYRKKESKGFLVYKNIVLEDISREPADYLIRIEQKSRKEKDETIVYLIVMHNDENLLDRGDAIINSNIKTFLNRLAPEVEAYHLEQEIKTQEELVLKAEKKSRNLQEDQQSLEKKIKNLQDDLRDNARDQESQQKELERQRQSLEAMKGKRKS